LHSSISTYKGYGPSMVALQWKFFDNCEVTFYPSTHGSMSWLYLKVHMLLVKEKCKMYLYILNCVCSWKQIFCFLCIIYD
jgi:hypothetical protein